jgi:hypothetical protein
MRNQKIKKTINKRKKLGKNTRRKVGGWSINPFRNKQSICKNLIIQNNELATQRKILIGFFLNPSYKNYELPINLIQDLIGASNAYDRAVQNNQPLEQINNNISNAIVNIRNFYNLKKTEMLNANQENRIMGERKAFLFAKPKNKVESQNIEQKSSEDETLKCFGPWCNS